MIIFVSFKLLISSAIVSFLASVLFNKVEFVVELRLVPLQVTLVPSEQLVPLVILGVSTTG